MDRYPRLSQDILEELSALGITPQEDAPVHLLFSSAAPSPKSPLMRAHVQSSPLPAGALLRLSPHVLIVSPELCFVQMAAVFPFARLILAGCELCGAYAIVGGELPGRTPLTSRAQLAAFIGLSEPISGIRAAQRAIPHVLDNAASPMEAKLALLLCLRHHLGGFGLPRPALNEPFKLSREACRIYPHGNCRCDLYWPHIHHDLEYQGLDYHADEPTITRDAARQQALRADGITVDVITYPQVADRAAFEVVALPLAKTLGHRLRIRLADHRARQEHLRADLHISARYRQAA